MPLDFDPKVYDWVQYKRNERGHNAGNHINCEANRCTQRRDIETMNETHLYAIALFEELLRRDLDAHEYLDDDYDSMRDLADMEFPDWLPQDVDFVQRLRAKLDASEKWVAWA